MLTTSTVIYILFAATFLYTGINYFLNLRSIRKDFQYLLFGVLCFLCSCYALAILYKYHSTDLASCVLAVKFQILFVRLIVVIIPWFIGFYTGYLPKRLLTSISVSAFLIGVLKLALPDSLAFSHLVGIKYLIAPWGEHLTILDCQTDWLTYCIYVVYVFFLIYCFLALRHLLQRGQWMKAWPLMVSLVFAVFVFANDVQVAAGRFHTMYLEEYGFFLYILLVGLWLTSKRIYAESNYRTLFNSVNDGIFVHDARSGMILDVNETAARMFGTTRQDLLTADPVRFMSGQEPYTVERALQRIKQALTEGPQVFEWLSRRLDNGSLFPTEVALHLEVIDNQPVVLAAVRDISLRKKAEEEKKAMEDQMRQAQKLESLGLMAGSVAHDFNNLLGVILGNVQLAKRALPTGAASSHLDQVTDTARRAAALCQQLLAYSGKSVFLIESYDLRQIVTDIARILEVSISKKIRLELKLPENLPPILADATQVGQVVMNLITNASEAIGGEKGSIALSITLRNMKRAEFGGFLPEPDLPEGPYVVLEVADTGRGMDDKTVARVFEPFFTTKFPGRGLGMAAVLGIIRGHQGGIRIASEPGKGTTVTVLLPAAPEKIAGVKDSKPLETPPTAPPPSGRPASQLKVLVVDDDRILLSTVVMLVESMGYRVIQADCGKKALEIFAVDHGELSCVFMDLTMPDLDGGEVLQEMKNLDPKVPVILTSGYSEQEAKDRIRGQDIFGFLQKPFLIEDLEVLIHRAAQGKNV